MTAARKLGCAGLGLLYAAGLLADLIAPGGYAAQDRDHPSARPTPAHWLGTDELGRDRLARLVHGTRVSLFLAPAAAAIATALAAVAGFASAVVARRAGQVLTLAFDVLLSLPLLFLLITLRAALPLQVPPWTSLLITFTLLGLLGWPSSARIVRAAVLSSRDSNYALQARAAGLVHSRLFAVHLLPHLRPVLAAQFLLLIPVFILGEANLGILGLGVVEPLPSWGSLLAELHNLDTLPSEPWRTAPALALLSAVLCFHLAGSRHGESPA